ncbi:RmlC-like cupin domain-containing protein [Limtongia smithiae]|uniref:RmlC-like cupin domain-containing protein n=1 Tax=Limtongia smithiae TaxID=1125753 RepID=UPI0034CD1300
MLAGRLFKGLAAAAARPALSALSSSSSSSTPSPPTATATPTTPPSPMTSALPGAYVVASVSAPFAAVASIATRKMAIPDFDALVAEIRAEIQKTSGLDAKEVNVKGLMETMRRYTSQRTEWGRFALEDPSRSYTRNGVDDIEDKANLLVLVWNPGKSSLIHDHADAHCVMKILEGNLVETVFKWPDKTAPPAPMEIDKQQTYRTDDVAYIADDIGLHRISNNSPNKIAVSLHLYTPPWAAKFGCHAFDEKTGKQVHVDLSNLYSYHGIPRTKHADHV